MRLRLLLLACTFGLAACTSAGGYLRALPTATPAPPRTAADTLTAAALHYAFVSPGDAPDGEFLPSRRRIALSTAVTDSPVPLGALTTHALPASGRVAFVLLSPAQLRALALERGQVRYGVVGRPEIQGDTAAVFVGTRSLTPSPLSAEGFTHGASGYTLRFVRGRGGWTPLGPYLFVMS